MPLRKRPIAVLWNTAAGWDEGDKEAGEVRDILSENGAELNFVKVNKGDNIVDQSRELVRSGSQILVAAGGDGTVNAVGSAVVNTSAALAVIPAGTLNHFARDLMIPLDPAGAAVSIKNGHEVVIDVGSVNDRIFINNSVLGLYPVYFAARQAFERRGLGKSRIGRFFAVLRAIMRVFWHFPHLKLLLRLEDGRSSQVRTPFVLVANNEHELENWNIGHRRSMNEGHLWVYVMRRCSRWTALGFLARFLLKRFSRFDAFTIYRVSEMEVAAKSKYLKVGVDGEIIRMETPLVYRSLPQSLRVIAPPEYLAAGIETA